MPPQAAASDTTNTVVEWLTVSAVARRLGVAEATVRYYERAGRLSPQRASNGTRLYQPADVDRLAEQRERAAALRRGEVVK
jgi:DNA-binding transcriptional MerR regulator